MRGVPAGAGQDPDLAERGELESLPATTGAPRLPSKATARSVPAQPGSGALRATV